LKFSAVAFDLDGTLYPNFRLNIRLIPFLLKDQRLLRAMGTARERMRKYGGNYPEDLQGRDFYEIQAVIMAEILGKPAEKVREETERLIYRGWEPLFKNIRLFPFVRETLDAFRNKGLKLGLLSDFPPETKLVHLKADGYWDTVLCSEETGYLKPDKASFLDLAEKMKTPPGCILYVGNSIRCDVAGAGRAGMKTALIRSGLKRFWPLAGGSRKDHPDFVFHDYRQLHDYVLG